MNATELKTHILMLAHGNEEEALNLVSFVDAEAMCDAYSLKDWAYVMRNGLQPTTLDTFCTERTEDTDEDELATTLEALQRFAIK